jgi:hypothetical protein
MLRVSSYWSSYALHPACQVRHGVMLVGAAGSGKTSIFNVLSEALARSTKRPHRQARARGHWVWRGARDELCGVVPRRLV